MYKLVIVAALISMVAADAPTSYARGEPLGLAEYNAPAPSSGGSFSSGVSSFSSGGGSSDGGNLDAGLLSQITQILGQNNGGSRSSSGSSGYAAPAPAPSHNQGGYSSGPSRSNGGGAIQLGQIEVAQRVAEFSLGGGSQRSSGGYQGSNQGSNQGGY